MPPPSYPPQPPHHQPGGYPGGGQWPPVPPAPAPAPLNAFAVVALVTSLVCLAPLGLVFGIVALRQISRRGERGKGLAVAGLSVSGAVLLLAAVLVPALDLKVWTVPARDDAGEVVREGWTTIDALETGDCFTPDDKLPEKDSPSLFDSGVRVTPCDQPHRAELYASFTLTGEEFPGRERIAALAWPRCAERFLDYSLDPAAFGRLQTYYFHPDERGWLSGRRTVLCWVGRPGTARLDHSVRNDGADLTPAQHTFLTALKPLNVGSVLRPANGPRDDLAGATAWAERMAEAQAESIGLLAEAELPGAQRPTEQLVAELEAGLPFWRQAAEASDADTFLGHLRSVDEHTGAAHARRIRELLELPVPGAGGDQVRYGTRQVRAGDGTAGRRNLTGPGPDVTS
ncbi:DUF4190 domain-containing protein [Streptomyces sp. B93]|uniref:DUF4190 domain-containing protein n=1 Tax=Streptomyces sp. B93 TaxID=2824875 RepID=UPI001FFD6C0A|nr:DUF4190 domain-containing protein [Streptomyces sp. B93]